jgi:hypothetical protein
VSLNRSYGIQIFIRVLNNLFIAGEEPVTGCYGGESGLIL